MNFSDPALEVLFVLAVLILTSIMDVVVLNFFVEAGDPRSHNKVKLVNECLARHQLAYPIWYITVLVFANFSKLENHSRIVVQGWMQIAIVLSVLFWLGGLKGVAGQDKAILRDHLACPHKGCEKGSVWLTVKVLALAGVLAAVSLTIALTFIRYPAVTIGLTK